MLKRTSNTLPGLLLYSVPHMDILCVRLMLILPYFVVAYNVASYFLQFLSILYLKPHWPVVSNLLTGRYDIRINVATTGYQYKFQLDKSIVNTRVDPVKKYPFC